MRPRISLLPAVAFLAISTGIAYGLSGLTVDKGSILITPPTVSGHIVVWGCPGSVRSIAPVRVKVYNKSQKVMKGGTVAGDGSFAVAATGFQGDKLNIKFVASTGGHKTIRMKVPGETSALPPPSGTVVVEEVVITGPTGDEEESEAVDEVLAPPPAADVEPLIPVVGEGGDAPAPVEEGGPMVPETLAPPPTGEERLVETGDLEELPVEMALPPDEQPSPLSSEEEAAAVERVLARPPAVDVEPVIPEVEEGGDAPVPVEESEPMVPDILAPPPPIEERLVETGGLEPRPAEVEVREKAGVTVPPATVAEKTPSAD